MTTSPRSEWQSQRPMGHNAPMRRALPLLFVALFVALSGCADKPIVHERRPRVYHSIISLSPGSTEIMALNADLASIKGRTAACNWPKNSLNGIPVVAQVKPDYEMIAKIHPDLIVYDKSLYSEQDIAKIKAIGADTFEFKCNTVDDYIKELYLLGSKLASETHFNDVATRVRVELAAADADRLPSKPKVAVIMPGPGGSDYIEGTKSFVADVVKRAGGEPVGPEADKFGPMNAEALVALNPDLIIVNASKTDLTNVGLIANDPRLKTITAVKTGKIQPIDGDVLLRRGQRVDQLIKALHSVMAQTIK